MITTLPSWTALENLGVDVSLARHDWACAVGEMRLEYGQHYLNSTIFENLLALAQARDLSTQIAHLFSGKITNVSAGRPALHSALRNFSGEPVLVDGQDIMPGIGAELERLRAFSQLVRDKGEYTDVVNIGIGGSDLGPKLVTEALREYHDTPLNFHFVSNCDPHDLDDCLKQLDPKTTLFIIASKSFETVETLINAKRACHWLGCETRIKNQCVAITAHPEKAKRFDHVFRLWDWVGGRFSIWGAIGLPVMLAIGFENFLALLEGAFTLDQHFQCAPLEKNMPVILALISLWYINFKAVQTQAVLPYAHRLRALPAYLQQLDMESLGKRYDEFDKPIHYNTGSIIWGGVGSNSQHSFHQLLHHGSHLVPADFILIEDENNQANLQNQNCHSQMAALYKNQQPANLITLKALTPQSLGQLLALYEHKIYALARLWGINPFDQPGVELGKQLLSLPV